MAPATEIGYGLENPGCETWQGQYIYLLQNVQTGPGSHPGSYSMGTEIISSSKPTRE